MSGSAGTHATLTQSRLQRREARPAQGSRHYHAYAGFSTVLHGPCSEKWRLDTWRPYLLKIR